MSSYVRISQCQIKQIHKQLLLYFPDTKRILTGESQHLLEKDINRKLDKIHQRLGTQESRSLIPGAKGTKGDRGAEGEAGQPGDVGRKGDQGMPGAKGAQGWRKILN